MTHPLTLTAALVSTAMLGFRHGFDYDHIAAIADITALQKPRQAMACGMRYALGHAATVAALGLAVVCFHVRLPARMDSWAERAIGLTLIALSVYVICGLIRGHGHSRPMSSLGSLVNLYQWAAWRIRNAFYAQPRPEPFYWSYSGKSAFLIGAVHGLGAETPSQLVLFLLAANLGGTGRGLLGIGMFIGGLLTMNAIMTASASGIFKFSADKPVVIHTITALSAGYSLCVGAIFMLGASGMLPALTGELK